MHQRKWILWTSNIVVLVSNYIKCPQNWRKSITIKVTFNVIQGVLFENYWKQMVLALKRYTFHSMFEKQKYLWKFITHYCFSNVASGIYRFIAKTNCFWWFSNRIPCSKLPVTNHQKYFHDFLIPLYYLIRLRFLVCHVIININYWFCFRLGYVKIKLRMGSLHISFML